MDRQRGINIHICQPEILELVVYFEIKVFYTITPSNIFLR